MSTAEEEPKREEKVPTILEPMYHLSPDKNEKFSPAKAKTIAKDILVGELDGKVDETSVENWADFGDELENLSKDVADKIKEKCKQSLNIPRCKILVQVTIGQMKDQGVKITSRCLWDTGYRILPRTTMHL